MKRYSLHLKNDPSEQNLETLVALHQSATEIVLTYGDLAEPKRFAKTMLARFKAMAVYHLREEASELSPRKDYLLVGINEKARMLCFRETNNATQLEKQEPWLETVRSFHLHWDNHSGFKVKWPPETQALTEKDNPLG